MSTSIMVILPDEAVEQPGRRFPTLYLLHGLSDDHTMWTRRSNVERYVAERGLAVVMPAVGRSWYADIHLGQAYWQYVSEELPRVARGFFPLSDKREDNFVAGLSMGGYGAFKLAMRKPENFAAAASLSGAMDLKQRMDRGEDTQAEFRGIFGPEATIQGGDNDLFALAKSLVESGVQRPALYQMCGCDDFLYEENIRFRDHARGLGLAVKYEEDAGYEHTWDYWDLTLQRVLDWLPVVGADPSRA